MCNSFTEDPVPMDWGISLLDTYRRTKIAGDFEGSLAWSSPWASTYKPILLDDLVSVGYILCELAQIRKDGLIVWKDSLANDEISLQNSKLHFFAQLEEGKLDECFSEDTSFIKNYLLLLYSEHKRMVDTRTNIDPLATRDGVLTKLLEILSEKSVVWKTMIRQGTRKVQGFLTL